MIIKTEVQGRYDDYFKKLFEDNTLSNRDKGMLVTLLGMPENWSFSINRLTQVLPEAANTIDASIRRLEEKGYVRRNRIRKDGRTFLRNDIEMFFPEDGRVNLMPPD